MESIREIKSGIMSFRLRTDGIIEAIPNTHWKGEIGENELRTEIEALKVLDEGNRYPILLNLPDSPVNKQARDYVSSLPSLTVGIAVLIKNPFHRILGNFLTGMNKVASPLKLFTTEAEAIKWLYGLQKNLVTQQHS